MLSSLGLGTVQFGLDYGVSNRAGRPSEGEVAAILARAVEAGIGYLDTAPAYGEAEILVGRHLPRHHDLRIITKLSPIAEATIEARHGATILETLARSLEHLRLDRVHGVVVHHAGDLAKPGAEHIVDVLIQARARGWADRIGVSIYDAEQLVLAQSRFQPQLVQLPLNVLDRRLIQSGTLPRLKAHGVEVHARSVFLQGALLMKPSDLPQFFAPVREHIAGVQRQWGEAGLTALGGCLAFALRRPEIDAVIVGVNRLNEFDDIVAAIEEGRDVCLHEPTVSIDPFYLDPSRWPMLGRPTFTDLSQGFDG
jgi:aryl-alcohol dehydrogenase-like predicted oxidoreductase